MSIPVLKLKDKHYTKNGWILNFFCISNIYNHSTSSNSLKTNSKTKIIYYLSNFNFSFILKNPNVYCGLQICKKKDTEEFCFSRYCLFATRILIAFSSLCHKNSTNILCVPKKPFRIDWMIF